MNRWLAIFAILVLVGSVAAKSSQEFQQRIQAHAGIARSYVVRAPASSKPPVAIVVRLHGHTGSAERLTGSGGKPAPYRQWNAIADREDLLLVAPQGIEGGDGKSGWKDCRVDAQSNPQSDDVAFIRGIVTTLRREYRVTSSRVYVLGSSNGGQMALRMAIERPHMVTAAAAIIASMPARSACRAPKRFVPVLFMNGIEDPLMPFDGGSLGDGGFQRGSVLSTRAPVDIWAKLSGASSTPDAIPRPELSTADNSKVFRETYAMRNSRPVVMLYRIEGGGHLEPGRAERYPRWLSRLLGNQNGDVEMADEVWAFFAAQSD